MTGIGQWIATILWLYWLVLIIRVIFDLIQTFSRDWQPKGVLLLIAEGVYTITDPPLKLLRRIIPPLRMGPVAFDIAFLVLLFGLQILISIISRL